MFAFSYFAAKLGHIILVVQLQFQCMWILKIILQYYTQSCSGTKTELFLKILVAVDHMDY